ncbi:hypothetical protein GBA52_028459 [Prunus armeniaca]|nr:hypothetical protein GBA52_028459 [Prunus armeniaca]
MRWMLKKTGCDCLASLLVVLQQGSADARIASARILESIAVNAEAKFLISEKDGLLSELLKLTGPEKDPTLIERVFSCLIAVSTPRRVKVRLVHLGAVKWLSKLLGDLNSATSTIEKVLKVLEMASSVKEGRAKICEDGKCVAGIVQRLLKVSGAAMEHAVTILWSVCYLFKERAAQEAVAKANGLTKILLLMQSNCSPAVRQISAPLPFLSLSLCSPFSSLCSPCPSVFFLSATQSPPSPPATYAQPHPLSLSLSLSLFLCGPQEDEEREGQRGGLHRTHPHNQIPFPP